MPAFLTAITRGLQTYSAAGLARILDFDLSAETASGRHLKTKLLSSDEMGYSQQAEFSGYLRLMASFIIGVACG